MLAVYGTARVLNLAQHPAWRIMRQQRRAERSPARKTSHLPRSYPVEGAVRWERFESSNRRAVSRTGRERRRAYLAPTLSPLASSSSLIFHRCRAAAATPLKRSSDLRFLRADLGRTGLSSISSAHFPTAFVLGCSVGHRGSLPEPARTVCHPSEPLRRSSSVQQSESMRLGRSV